MLTGVQVHVQCHTRGLGDKHKEMLYPCRCFWEQRRVGHLNMGLKNPLFVHMLLHVKNITTFCVFDCSDVLLLFLRLSFVHTWYVYLPLRCQCICASDVHVRVSALRSHGWKSCPTAFLPYSLFCLLMVSCRHPYCNSLCDLVWRERNALQEDDLKRHSCYRLQMCILKGEKVFAFIFLSAVLSTIKYFCHTMDLTVLWMADK